MGRSMLKLFWFGPIAPFQVLVSVPYPEVSLGNPRHSQDQLIREIVTGLLVYIVEVVFRLFPAFVEYLLEIRCSRNLPMGTVVNGSGALAGKAVRL